MKSTGLVDSRKQTSNLEENIHILNELMSSDVSYLNLNKTSFKKESGCWGSRKKAEGDAANTIAYVKKGLIFVDKNKSKVIIPEANYYEFEEILDRSNDITREYKLIDNFPYNLYWTLQGEHKQTEDWHIFYSMGGFCGPGGIGATSRHSSIYTLSGYEKFKKLEKIRKNIMEKEPEFLKEIKHTDDIGSYEVKRSNPWKYRPDELKVYSEMPWPIVEELNFLAGLLGPLPLPDIKKLRNLMGISETDESYII